MEANNKIIERILKDAQTKCDDIIAKAQAKKQELLQENESRLLSRQQKLESDCIQQGKEIAHNSITNAEMQLKKLRLSRKRELLDQVYTLAYKKVLDYSSKEYLALVERILKEYAEKGETVDFAKKDEKLITQAFLDKLGLKLKLGNACEIEGGVILQGDGYDKDLSLSALFDAVRSETEIEVANILFGSGASN